MLGVGESELFQIIILMITLMITLIITLMITLILSDKDPCCLLCLSPTIELLFDLIRECKPS